jgi:predicted small lipoprotein YifL
MGKFRSVVSALLAISMLASMAGCAQKIVLTPPSESTTPAASESTEESKAKESETSATESSASETSATESSATSETKESAASSETSSSSSSSETTAAGSSLRKVTVSNAYRRSFKSGKKTYTTQYPKITVDGLNTSKVNKEIADTFKSIAKKNTSRIYYSYYVRKYLISVVVTVEVEAGNKDNRNYYVYNVSRINGKKLTRAQVLKSLGYKNSTFDAKVKAGVKKMWKNYKTDTAAAKKMYNNSLASKKIVTAMPYMNANGKVCYLLRQIEVPGTPSKIDIAGTL